jgi:hypothetical protein
MEDKVQSAIPSAPTPQPLPGDGVIVDEVGQAIIALLGKAAQTTKESCTQAMDVADRLLVQIRAAEERIRKAEAEAAHNRDRATCAEAWIIRISEEIERLFFENQHPTSQRGAKPY